LLTQNSM